MVISQTFGKGDAGCLTSGGDSGHAARCAASLTSQSQCPCVVFARHHICLCLTFLCVLFSIISTPLVKLKSSTVHRVHTQKKNKLCKWYLYPSKFHTAIESRHLYKRSLKTRFSDCSVDWFDMKCNDYCKTLFASLCVNVFTYWRYDTIIQFFNYHCVHE